MLNPASIAHLIFRNTVTESLEAVAAGQANYAVVPLHNSITQGEGSVMKALAGGGLEIFAQVCMPTSYVLVAHKDYLAEFVRNYTSVIDPNAQRSPEAEAKNYTRFLTKIYVGTQAEEQYRGRLIRPDMMSASVEPTRNPLRVLEDLTRTDLMRAMLTAPRGLPMGGGFGNTPYNPGAPGTAIRADIPAPPVLDTIQAPAALVASGLLDAPGDPEGWDRQGSLGEIVQLLRNLLVLLNVYSFGPPDLPTNTTQYVLVGRKGLRLDANALNSPSAAQRRVMTLVRPGTSKSSGDQWMKPREALTKRIGGQGYVLDKPPVLVTNGGARAFLFEGGKVRDGVLPVAGTSWLSRIGESLAPSDEKGKKPTSRIDALRKSVEKKPSDRIADQTAEKFTTAFLGEYPSWCVNDAGQTSANCVGCEEAHGNSEAHAGVPDVAKGLAAALVALFALALIMVPFYCAVTGNCAFWGSAPRYQPPLPPTETAPPAEEQSAPATTPKSTTRPVIVPDRPRDNASTPPEAKVEQPKATPPAAPVTPAPATVPPAATEPTGPKVESTQEKTSTPYPGVSAPPPVRTNPYPGLTKDAPPPTYAPETGAKGPAYDWSKPTPPRQTSTTTTTTPAPVKTAPPAVAPAAPRVDAQKPPMFHVAFFEAKTNLSYEAMNAVTAAAAQAIQSNRPVQVRLVSLGPRETNVELWRRRLYAVKDELVRLGVPADRIRAEGTGPYLLTIRPNQPVAAARTGSRRASNYSATDSIPDPMSQD